MATITMPERGLRRGILAEPRGEGRLIDNGKWHTIELDVRSIREASPAVDHITRLRLGSMESIDNGNRVREGDQYSIGEIYIGQLPGAVGEHSRLPVRASPVARSPEGNGTEPRRTVSGLAEKRPT